MNNFIKIKNLYKIFGNNNTEALNLVKTSGKEFNISQMG